MKKISTAVAMTATALMLGGGLVACGSGSNDSGSTGGGATNAAAIITTDGAEPQNPLVTTNTNEDGGGRVLEQLYTGLVSYGPDGSVNNAVAESITPNDDATEFTVKLKDWTFSNGEPVTADSFIDAWNYGAAAKNAQLGADFFSSIKGFEQVNGEGATLDKLPGLKKVNDKEFVIELGAPESDFATRLGYTVYSPLPKAFFEDPKAFGENPIGNGRYKMADNGWKHNESINLVANEAYPGEDKAKNGGVEFRLYDNQSTAYADLQSNNLDLMYKSVPSTALATYKDDFPDSNIQKPAASSSSFTIPERAPHFGPDEEGNLRRQAISMAINRELIIDKILHGAREIAKDFTSPTIGDGTPDIPGNEVLTYNPEKAKELWKKADEISPWSGTFEIAFNADGGHSDWIEAVTNDISQNLGIEAHGKAYPTFKALRDDVTKKTINTAFRSGWVADYPSPANFLIPMYRTGGSSNDGDYSNPEFDRLVNEGQSETDKAKALAKYNEAQAILMKELPQIPMWYGATTAAWNPALKGVDYSWDGQAMLYNIEKN